MPNALRFQATCPRCGERATFLAAKVEKAVLTQAQVAADEHPGFQGFRCLSCRKLVMEMDDEEGYAHRWAQGQPVTYPIETGVPDQR